MKQTIAALLLFISLLLLISAISRKSQARKDLPRSAHRAAAARNPEQPMRLKLSAKSAHARDFAKEMGFNRQFCFLIDMSVGSAQKRFFVYDLDGDSVLRSGLVTHGRCNEDWLEGRRYSNVMGSGCTSLGKYRIGASYKGRFGQAYKLHGLDASNKNAFKRFVVLHGHDCVPAAETGDEICQSDGCPTVAPEFLKTLRSMIDKSAQPVLLWIFE